MRGQKRPRVDDSGSYSSQRKGILNSERALQTPFRAQDGDKTLPRVSPAVLEPRKTLSNGEPNNLRKAGTDDELSFTERERELLKR